MDILKIQLNITDVANANQGLQYRSSASLVLTGEIWMVNTNMYHIPTMLIGSLSMYLLQLNWNVVILACKNCGNSTNKSMPCNYGMQ